MNVALEGLESSQNYLEVYFPGTVDIYVYDNPQAIHDALPDAEQNWIAGHADPDQGVILVSHTATLHCGLHDAPSRDRGMSPQVQRQEET